MIPALAFLQNAWTAFSPIAAIAGLSGIGLLVLAFVGLSWLPGFLKRPLIFAGVVLIAGAAIYQAGQAKGAHDAFARDAARALAAEKTRTAIAKDITDRVSIQAVRDLAEIQATNKKLQGINDVLAKDSERDRRCTTHDDARRLRDL
ncbi:hypothetical protein [Methylobacterium iners]|uniref:Uncharacterized protein n=1 Tax=Methylobacterium iners TaxID=418707 RepID=A0ABQ4RQA9_9HYPH|nr:hypothetical protein [Methylobacterium iners]GJD92946.1 hypothetical protein OCOJLMKI_0129 [Methylobacterium iners]